LQSPAKANQVCVFQEQLAVCKFGKHAAQLLLWPVFLHQLLCLHAVIGTKEALKWLMWVGLLLRLQLAVSSSYAFTEVSGFTASDV